MPRFHIHTLGCKVNRAESETIAAALLANGWEQAESISECDVAILNTCTVTGEADAKNRKALHALLRDCAAPILVTGCAINIDADFYADIDERITCEHDKSHVPLRAQELLTDRRSAAHNAILVSPGDDALLDARASNAKDFRTRVDLKIQDGCDNACSFCIVHVARGPARSIPASQVLEQTHKLAQAGTQELVLVGIDLAAYHDDTIDLAALVDTLLEQTNIGRVRISSVEPQSITPSLISAFERSSGRLCRHLHVCLQSGSDKVLHEMNRRYDTAHFMNSVEQLKNAAPSIALSTDVIVGFPGETDEDFEQSLAFIEKCGFMRLHVFRYSKRPGTPAAKRDDQIDPKVKAMRSNALIELGDKLMLADMERRIGTSEEIVIERPGLGTSESYHAASCDPRLDVGTLVRLELVDIDKKSKRFIAR